LETLFSKPLGHITTLSAVLPSALSAIGILALTYFFGRSINIRTGWLSVLILATIPNFWLEAGSVTIDMLLAFNITATILCLHFRDNNQSSAKRIAYTVGATIFLLFAFLTKGPIGIVLPAISWGGYLLWERRWKNLFSFALFIISIGLLYMAIELIIVYHAGGRQLVYDVIKMQITGRITDKANKSFIYYPICLIEIGSIWWLVIISGLARSYAGKSEKSMFYQFAKTVTTYPATRLAIMWFLGIFAVFTLAGSKHSRYLLPLYPAAAIIFACLIETLFENRPILYENILRNIINVLIGTILLAGLIFPFLCKQFIFIPLSFFFIWFAVNIAFWLIVRTRIEEKYKLVGSILLLLIVVLSGSNLMVIPAYSGMASGRAFITAAESKVGSEVPVDFYGISSDGDGIKFALYSKRKSTEIRFINTIEELNPITKPCLLISHLDDKTGFKKFLSENNCDRIMEGKIYSKQFVACLLGSGE
ncbi:MAG: glycosyltransferase family 39 protein, partial [Proteobacteria bacterium]|nr:glycosyltransferase family 39 protein [Pseudomonadota bacterium]